MKLTGRPSCPGIPEVPGKPLSPWRRRRKMRKKKKNKSKLHIYSTSSFIVICSEHPYEFYDTFVPLQPGTPLGPGGPSWPGRPWYTGRKQKVTKHIDIWVKWHKSKICMVWKTHWKSWCSWKSWQSRGPLIEGRLYKESVRNCQTMDSICSPHLLCLRQGETCWSGEVLQHEILQQEKLPKQNF